jgi:endonuclease III
VTATPREAESALGIREAVRVLAEHHGSAPVLPTLDAFELILWENVAYLASPARRLEAFAILEERIGTSPAAILKASRSALEAVTSRGILKGAFAAKLRECARIAVEDYGGDVGGALRAAPSRAKRILRSFPGIGEPGADKILLFAGLGNELAPESNGLRVLVRLGLLRDEGSYSRTYAASRRLAEELPKDSRSRGLAHLLLREHGQVLCRRSRPRCDACPLQARCAHARGGSGPT